jgi:uncharacterized delta-60 repeat protein
MKKSVIRTILLITTLWIIAPVMAADVTMEWNASFDDGNNDYAQGIAVDSDGNVYVTGASDQEFSNYAYRTIKYNSSGGHVWNVSYDTFYDDSGAGIAVDDAGNVYVTGYSDSGADYDYYTIKYNSSGGEVWNADYDGGNGDDYGQGIAVDSSGNVYVTGYIDGGASSDYYTIKYNSSGDHVWNVSYDGGGTDKAYGIAVDSSGNVYVTGESYIGGNYDYYTIKYNSSGNHVWNATYDGGITDEAYGIAVDENYVYVTGVSYFGGDDNYYTIKYDTNGNHVWNVSYDGGSYDEAHGIAVDSSGNVYVTGNIWDSPSYDYYTIKYDSSGNEVWNISYNGGSHDYGKGVAVDSSNNVYVTGYSTLGGNPDYYTIKYSQASENTTRDYIEMGLADLSLSYSSEEIDGLESLYNNATGSFTAGSDTWYYSGDAMAGHSLGDGWEYAGAYYIKVGSGITTQSQEESASEGYVNVSITTTLAIEIIQEDVDFGEGAVDAGESNAELYTNQANAPTQNRGNWTLPNAYAIEVRNVGNINCSLDVGSSKTASSFLGGTNPEYQWKVSDKESGSCSGGLTHGSWYDVNSSARLCQHLSPINSSDEIFLDIRVVVPYDANPTGSLVHKTDILTLTASATA